MDWDTNWAAIAIGVLFFLGAFSQLSESVRTRAPWSAPLLLIVGTITVLVGVFWNNWDSHWFKFPVVGLLIMILLLPMLERTRTDFVKIRFVRAIWDGMNSREPHIDFIFQLSNLSHSPIAVVGVSGWIEIDGSRCSLPPQTSRQDIARRDARAIRIQQPLPVPAPRLARRRQAEFTFSTCSLVLETGAELRLEGVRNLMVP